MHFPTLNEKRKTVRYRKKILKQRATPSETIFRKRLDDAGIHYQFQKGFISGKFYCFVDFYLPSPKKICIEIDGGYHNTPEQQKKDFAKDQYLKGRKFKVIRIKNEDVSKFYLTTL